MANSADPDQLASSDLDLLCLQNTVYLGSGGQRLNVLFVCVEVLIIGPVNPMG